MPHGFYTDPHIVVHMQLHMGHGVCCRVHRDTYHQSFDDHHVGTHVDEGEMKEEIWTSRSVRGAFHQVYKFEMDKPMPSPNETKLLVRNLHEQQVLFNC